MMQMMLNGLKLFAAAVAGFLVAVMLTAPRQAERNSDPLEPAKWNIVEVGTLYGIDPPSGDRRGDFYWNIGIDGKQKSVPSYEGPLNPVIGESYELQKSISNSGHQVFRLRPHIDWKDRGYGKLMGVTWFEDDEFEVKFELPEKTQPHGVRIKHVTCYGRNLEHANYKIGRPYTLQHAFWNGRELQRLVP